LRCIRTPRPAHFRAARAPLAFAFVIALGALVVPAGPAVPPAAATTRATMTTVDAADLSPAAAETTLVAMINADRAAVGLAPLRVDARLSAIARERSASMAAAGQLSHVQPDGRTMTDLIQAAGITWYSAGETIGWNNYPKLGDSTRIVNQGWMSSPEHTAIIRSTAYNYFGLGLAISPSGDRYWTAIFLRGPDLTPPWAKMNPPATGLFVTLASRGQAVGRAHRGASVVRRAAPGRRRCLGLRSDVDDQPLVVDLDPGGPPDGRPGAGARPGGQHRELVGSRERLGLTLSPPWQPPPRAPGWTDRGGR
jgi:uncharacterized protein YkwD